MAEPQVVLSSTSAYGVFCSVTANGYPVSLTCVFGGTGSIALGHLLLEAQVTVDGPWITLKEDADFSTVDNLVSFVGGSGLPNTPIYQTASGGSFTLGLAGGFYAYRLSGKIGSAGVVAVTPYVLLLN